jgi:hypothetical protein
MSEAPGSCHPIPDALQSVMSFVVKKKGGAFGQRADERLWEIDTLSWSVRNIDLKGGKRKLKWEVNPTELVVIGAEEATCVGRFSITGDGAKDHQEQVVTFASSSELVQFVSVLKRLGSSLPPANSRASRKVPSPPPCF